MMRIRLPLIALAASAAMLAAGFSVPRFARADAHTYVSIKHQINVGMITSSALNLGNTGSENPDPHFFYVLERRTDLKPLGLEFVNPLAPPVITGAVYDRWQKRQNGNDPAFISGTPQNRAFQIGAKVTKNMGAYWEVNLDSVTAEDLHKFDLLYIHTHIRNISFSADQREKLRKYADGGGTLFVEDCGGMTFNNNAPFLFDVNMHSGTNAAAGGVIANQNHPLMSEPYVISSTEVQTLGDKRYSDYYLYKPDPANPNDTGPGPDNINPPGGVSLVPIIWNTRGIPPANVITPAAGWRPYMLAGTLGAGRVVFSSADIGCAVNDYVGGAPGIRGGNSGAISGETMLAAHPTDLKVMYNMALWSVAHSTVASDVRRSGGTNDRPGAKLLEKWVTPVSGAGSARVGGPCFYKHCVFFVDGNMVLHCMDAIPGEDLDGDGNSDDGAVDFLIGQPYDEIWSFPLLSVPGAAGATGASTPTAIEFYDPDYVGSPGVPAGLASFKNREQIIVVLSNGLVVAVRAFPRVAANGFPLANQTGYEWVADIPGRTDFNMPNATYQVPAAAWSEGILFVSVNTAVSGQVAAIDPVSGASAFNLGTPPAVGQGMAPGDPVTNAIGQVLSSPAVGYVKDDASGANDKMIYVHVQRRGVGNVPDSIQAIPFGTRGEPLTRQGTSNAFRSRSSGLFPPPSWYMVPDPNGAANRNTGLRQRVYATYRDPASNAMLSVELRFDLTGANYTDTAYTYTYTSGQPPIITLKPTVVFNSTTTVDSSNENLTVYADYALDWATVYTTKVKFRSALFGPQDVGGPTGATSIGGAPALSSEDMVYFNSDASAGAANNNIGGNGVIFASAEQGSNRSALKWAFSMHDGFNITLDDGTTRQVLPRLRFVKPDGVFGSSGGPVGTFLTQVNFQASPAVHNGIVYSTATGMLGGQAVSLICAFRANPEIKLKIGQGIDRNVPIQIRQVNPVTQQKIGNGAALTLPQQNYTVDYASGIVRIQSMAFVGGTNGFFSTSIPFQVKVGNAPEFLVFGTQVDSVAGNDEARIIGPDGVDNLQWFMVVPPTINKDNNAYSVGAITTSPSIQGDVMFVGTANGYVLAFDADPGANDPAAQTVGAQVKLLKVDIKETDPEHLRWVQAAGQGNAPIISPPVGTAAVLAVSSSAGMSMYEDSKTLIADNKRLIEVNAAGDAVWTCDGTRSYGVAGGDLPVFYDPITGNPVGDPNASGVAVQQRVAWSRPQVAHRVNNNNLLVVDSGNNRVVEIDRGGGILWEVNRLQGDMLLDTDGSNPTSLGMQGMFRPGDPLTLNEPTDCVSWTEIVPQLGAWLAQYGLSGYGVPNVPGYVLHYLIADTGNFRIIEVVDVLDSVGQVVSVNTPRGAASLRRQLLYVTASYAKGGKKYRYRSVQRLTIPNQYLVPPFKDPNKPNNALIQFTLALVQNYRLVGNPNAGPGAAINTLGQVSESGGGSIVVMNAAGEPISVVSNLRVPDPANPGAFIVQPIVNPVWFSKFDEFDRTNNRPTFKYLMCDANGCYQMKTATDAMGNQDPRFMDVEWMLGADDYYAMTGKKLNASSIERLNTAVTDKNQPGYGFHHFLITNRFNGVDNPLVFGITFATNKAQGNISGGNEFHGEVFELDPARFSFGLPYHGYQPDYLVTNGNFLKVNDVASIIWRSPTERLPAIGTELGVIQRFIGDRDKATSTSILEQPAFADRPF